MLRCSRDILTIIEITMTQCRRDMLWQAMLNSSSQSEDGAAGGSGSGGSSGRRKHRSGWASNVSPPPPALDDDQLQVCMMALRMTSPCNISISPGVADASRDVILQSSTYADWQQLLTMVERIPLSDVDAHLLPLQTMPLPWYRSLQRALQAKYRHCHRFYASHDHAQQYLVITSQSCPDVIFMVST